MRLLFLLLLSLSFTASFCQPESPVTWEMESKQVNANEFDLIFKADIDDGWTIYSQYLESDDGPNPTEFIYDEGEHFSLVGKTEESDNAVKKYDKVFEMNVVKFFEKASFTQRVKVNDFGKPIKGYFVFMTCDATKCLPPTDVDFNFTLVNTMGAEEEKEETPEPEKEEQPSPEDQDKNKQGELGFSSESGNGSSGNNTDQQITTNTDEEVAPNRDLPEGFKQPVKFLAKIKKNGNQDYDVIFNATIDDGWFLYSQFQESEDGPMPTTFTYDESENYELVGKAEESANRKNVYDKIFGMNVQKFSKSASFTQKIKIKDPSIPTTAYFEFQTCDDKECIPVSLDIFIDAEALKVYVGDSATRKIELLNSTGAEKKEMASTIGDTINQARPAIVASFQNPEGNCGGETQKGSGWIWTFIMGFGGGLLALLTPCVFPMIPLTVSFFTKGSKTRVEGIKNGLIYGASIIVIYVSFGLLITAAFGADALNLLSTHWLPNVLFFAIFIIFAISFFGYFEITLPSSWTTKTDSMADQGGLIGTFFMAATLALVSFSCTGPIIGSALVESATDPMGPFVVMLGFSTALALPFGLFAAFPAWLNSLPQSGGWMTSVKVVLGFLELALAFKFLSVADYTYDWGFLRYELFLGIWVTIGIATTMYLLGYIRFPHDSPLKKISLVRAGFIGIFAVSTIYLALGFRYSDITKSYKSPTLLSGLAPPSIYNFFLPTPEVNPEIKKQYPSFTKCANNLDCFKDYYEGLDYARKNNKPILVDFTGKGCVNCRRTEDNVWVIDDVRNNIDTNFVLISLYVDIRDKLKKEVFSEVQNKKLRTKGNLWADFQYANFNQQSQPLYVLMTPEEKVLARPVGYQEGWTTWRDYNDYLNCGLQTYEGVKKDPLGMNNE
ncbi:MAG: cytochrome c biogenesis protein CcdA [Bacteroidota bacterium]